MARKTRAKVKAKAKAAPKRIKDSPELAKQPDAIPPGLASNSIHAPDEIPSNASLNSHKRPLSEVSFPMEPNNNWNTKHPLDSPSVENESLDEVTTTLEAVDTVHPVLPSASPRACSPEPSPALIADDAELSPPSPALIADEVELSTPSPALIGDDVELSLLPKPTSRKRSCSIVPESPGTSNKRSKMTPSISSSRNGNGNASRSTSQSKDAPPTIDKETWQGFCEIESDPAYFSVLLRDMGVRNVTVREVFAMDPALLETLPQPIYGLILLFHYREFGNDDQASQCPATVWFANQQPAQNSCATLAMMNILMNNAGIQVGEHLDQFKEFTSNFTPYHRGEALANFDFVKRIHNSFAKKMDILEGDKALSYKVRKAQRAKDEIERAGKPGKGKDTKSRGRRDISADSIATNGSEETYEQTAHHYIAFIPVGNDVWKLDGLDAQPTNMGSFSPEKGETWLSVASDTIAALMVAGDDDYGVIALAQSPLLSLRSEACLALNTLEHIEARLDALDSTWRSSSAATDAPPTVAMLHIEAQITTHPISDSLRTQIDTDLSPDLLLRRSQLISELNGLEANIIVEMQSEVEEDQKAAQRRFDCGPVIKKWLEMLAENGCLEENLERFMPSARGRKGGKR